jgi:glutathione S-transferase
LMEAFELKTRASLKQLEDEAQALNETPFSIGHIAVGCALGYLDYRFDAFGWRDIAPRLADWYAEARVRPSFENTEPSQG